MTDTHCANRYLGRKSTDRYFQLPQWGVISGVIYDLTAIELKLYIFFVQKAHRESRISWHYSVCDLAERCHVNRKYIRSALLSLAAKKLILPTGTQSRIQAFVLFDPPPDLRLELHQRAVPEEPLNYSPLEAKALNSGNHREPGGNLSHSKRHSMPHAETNEVTPCDKMGQEENTAPLDVGDTGYEPGTAENEFGGFPQDEPLI